MQHADIPLKLGTQAREALLAYDAERKNWQVGGLGDYFRVRRLPPTTLELHTASNSTVECEDVDITFESQVEAETYIRWRAMVVLLASLNTTG